jgi:hypothetical protein
MDIGDYLYFRSFITLPVIMVVYILGALAITLFSLLLMVGGLAMPSYPMGGYYYGNYPGGAAVILVGLIILIFGNIFWRIFCEYVAILFKIHERLVSLDSKTARPP